MKCTKIDYENKNLVLDDKYVLTACKNVTNKKTSFWLSKIGCTVAVYAYTPLCEAEYSLESMLEHAEAAIPYLEHVLRKERNK